MVQVCDVGIIIIAGYNIIIIAPTTMTWDAWFLTFFAEKIRRVRYVSLSYYIIIIVY